MPAREGSSGQKLPASREAQSMLDDIGRARLVLPPDRMNSYIANINSQTRDGVVWLCCLMPKHGIYSDGRFR